MAYRPGIMGLNSRREVVKLTILLLALVMGCAQPPAHAMAVGGPASGKVLVVINDASPDSLEVGAYYAKRRAIPGISVLHIKTLTGEEIMLDRYQKEIEAPIREKLKGSAVDYIVMTTGIPIRLNAKHGYAVDAFLSAMDLPITAIEDLPSGADLNKWKNPYFGSKVPFDHKKTGTYIVTRLIGYDVDQCKKLVDNAIAAKPSRGPFTFVEASNRNNRGYQDLQIAMERSSDDLAAKGLSVNLDKSGRFPEIDDSLAGYCSWGSNDGHFNSLAYHSLRFQPGALAQTFVSTSGRTFHPTQGGQSLIADLIEQGVTGVAGYVSEPYTFGLARPDILFDRYTKGFNLGESFAAASPLVKWKEIIVGDPLCRPYAKN